MRLFNSNYKEIWREIPDYPLYEASNFGSIRRKSDGKIISPYTHKKTGFMETHLTKEGEKKYHSVGLGKIIATTFIPKKDKDLNILTYKDGNYQNCKASNLEWKTKDSPMGGAKPPQKIVCVETGEIFKSQSKAASDLEISTSAICAAVNDSNLTAAGFHWQRYDEANLPPVLIKA